MLVIDKHAIVLETLVRVLLVHVLVVRQVRARTAVHHVGLLKVRIHSELTSGLVASGREVVDLLSARLNRSPGHEEVADYLLVRAKAALLLVALHGLLRSELRLVQHCALHVVELACVVDLSLERSAHDLGLVNLEPALLEFAGLHLVTRQAKALSRHGRALVHRVLAGVGAHQLHDGVLSVALPVGWVGLCVQLVTRRVVHGVEGLVLGSAGCLIGRLVIVNSHRTHRLFLGMAGRV